MADITTTASSAIELPADWRDARAFCAKHLRAARLRAEIH
jgi:hypothetical protein